VNVGRKGGRGRESEKSGECRKGDLMKESSRKLTAGDKKEVEAASF